MSLSHKSLPFAVRDAAFRQVVRCQFYRYTIAWHDTYKMLAHFTRDMRYDLMAVFKLDLELSTRKGLDNLSRQFNDFFFTRAHKYNVGSLYQLLQLIVKCFLQ